jgi:hypothetical protein
MNESNPEKPAVRPERQEADKKSMPPFDPEKPTDMELVIPLIKWIENPLEVEVAPGRMANERELYLREAKKILESGQLTNPFAIEMPEKAIKDYKDK